MVDHTKQGVRSMLLHRLSYEARQEQLMGNDGDNLRRGGYIKGDITNEMLHHVALE